MATTVRTNGLQHAISLGNIEVSSKANSIYTPTRCYDSEDETMSRRKTRIQSSAGLFPRGSVYSKGDIREQYCVTERQLQNSIERPRRERFFGCLSGRGAPQSFLGVCVGRRAPSDENVAASDYAPFHKYPRYVHNYVTYDDDSENSYFRRRPASILGAASTAASAAAAAAATTNTTTANQRLTASINPTRYTWMAADEDAIRLEGPRPICPTDYNDFPSGPYFVGDEQTGSYLSQSTEQLSGLYRCPAHIGLPPPPPPPILSIDIATPRIKHVSFARSHTLTSFDEAAAMGLRSSGRSLKSAQSQERLIGGKKPIITIGSLQDHHQTIPITAHIPMQQSHQPQQAQLVSFHHHPHSHPQLIGHHQQHPGNIQQSGQQQHQQPNLMGHQQTVQSYPTMNGLAVGNVTGGSILGFLVQQQPSMPQQQQHQQHHQQQHQVQIARQLHQHQSSLSPEVMVVEKVKRGPMKTQATQTLTDQRKAAAAAAAAIAAQSHLNLSLSPRTIHRVKMVSQGAQTNGMVNGRKLTKSLSEMTGAGRPGQTSVPGEQLQHSEETRIHVDHEQLHRTFSEEPPRSPLMCPQQILNPGQTISQHRFYEPPAPPLGAVPSQSRASSSRASTDILPPSSSSVFVSHPGSSRTRNHSDESILSYQSPTDLHHHSGYSITDGHQSVVSSAQSIASGRTVTTSTPTNSLDFHSSRYSYENMEGRSSKPFRNSYSGGGYEAPNRHYHYAGIQQHQADSFDYESNSLPRRVCGHSRGYDEFYSLPRREYYNVPEVVCRHATECVEVLNNNARNSMHFPIMKREVSRESSTDSAAQFGVERRRASTIGIDVTPKTHVVYRRPSIPVHGRRHHIAPLSHGLSTETEDENTAKTATTDNDDCDDAQVPRVKIRNCAAEEQEIFIDFKPHVSPAPSPRLRPNLQKQLSDGEILIDKRHSKDTSNIVVASASEEDLKNDENYEDDKEYYYQNLPIKDEGIFDRKPDQNLLTLPMEVDGKGLIRQKREAFRKRSISLEDPTAAEEPRLLSSAPPSPCQEDGGVQVTQSAYPSSDSLANDLTRDHSDGIWNESQVTVLPADSKLTEKVGENVPVLLTPSTKRKTLILQHQQRSSIDTDGLELEEQFSDHSLPRIPLPKLKPAATQTTISPSGSGHNQIGGYPTPAIAVTLSHCLDNTDDTEVHPKSTNSSRTLSPATQELRKIEPLVHGASPKRQPLEVPDGHDGTRNTTNDLSECSTNTDEYVTCTDNSKRTPGMKTPPTTATSSSSTQVPVSAQSSQTVQEGSSFESASSLYSTRGDGLSEDNPQTDETPSSAELPQLTSLISKPTQIVVFNNVVRPPPSVPESISPADPSPSHSASSSCSEAYGNHSEPALLKVNIVPPCTVVTNGSTTVSQPQQPSITTTTATTNTKALVTPMRRGSDSALKTLSGSGTVTKKKSESVSEEEKSEKRYSSSGYYESPHDEDQQRLNAKQRRARVEEERRRRKNNMKLDIERENLRALTSPIKKPNPQPLLKQQQQQQIIRSPEEKKQQALNILDGTSPNKMKRFRPKIKRQTRKLSVPDSGASTLPFRKPKLIVKSPEKYGDTLVPVQTKLTPTQFKTHLSPKKDQSCGPDYHHHQHHHYQQHHHQQQPGFEKQLKSKSIESLRSVSPGSDSVFYSEAGDLAPDQQVHCLHCGKEVEIITAPSQGSQESIPAEERPDIVKPPADFADSPITTKTSQRLYKKMDKRYRSEERHGERSRHYRNRHENVRAKSEERGKDQNSRSPPVLRSTGSSPCVLPDDGQPEKTTEKIYFGNFRNGVYTRLTDSDVWIQLDHQSFDHRHRDRRGSTDSEKAFHSKYQVILHRLVQRRCTLEMYHRQKQNVFKLLAQSSSPDSVRYKLEEILRLMLMVWAREGQALKTLNGKDNEIDKTVIVKSDSGEFGFRIHGSKPVVVAAIEPDTPAESCGLEVGDILISVNGIPVLDKHHTEVVKIAHAGCETLELEVARTIGVLMNEQQESSNPALYTGYLWRQSGQAKGSPNTKKWVRRWFSLRPDHCLYYYKTESDTQPVGAVMLTNHTVEHCTTDVGRQYAFKIDAGEGIPMYLAADTDETANRWVAVMSHASTQPDPWLELSTRNLKQPPNGIHRPDCFGYLMKMGSRWNGWSKRYCVLKDACIYFYLDGSSKCASGMACLQGYKIVAMSTNAAGRKNSFEIVPPESKLRHYILSTESEMDKKRWISALEYSIDRWIKAK